MENWDTRQLAGVGFLIGNATLFANGLIAHLHGDTPELKRAGVSRMTAAMAWNAGGVFLAKYGKLAVPKQLERLESKLAVHLQEQGVALDADALRKADEETRRGTFQKLEDYFYEHPIEMANYANSIASGGMLISGILRRYRGEQSAGNANLGIGVLALGASALVLLTPERTKEQIEESGQGGTLSGKLQERPLAYAAPLFLAGDLTFAGQAWGEHQSARTLPAGNPMKAWMPVMSLLSVATLATFFGGDALTGVSSKKMSGTPEEHSAAQEQVVQAAAKMLAAESLERREALVDDAVDYMSKQQWLRMVELKPEALKTRIMDAIEQQVVPVPAMAMER